MLGLSYPHIVEYYFLSPSKNPLSIWLRFVLFLSVLVLPVQKTFPRGTIHVIYIFLLSSRFPFLRYSLKFRFTMTIYPHNPGCIHTFPPAFGIRYFLSRPRFFSLWICSSSHLRISRTWTSSGQESLTHLSILRIWLFLAPRKNVSAFISILPFGMLNLITTLNPPYPRLKAFHHPVLRIILALQSLHHILIPCPAAHQMVNNHFLCLPLAVQALIGLGV